MIQTITIADQEFERAKDQVDFIRRYIFPGGCLPSLTAICNTLAGSTPLRLQGVEDLTHHYATTLRLWRERFLERIERIRPLGYPESFIRRWEYDLCYCEGGFHERSIGLVQLEIENPSTLGRSLPHALIPRRRPAAETLGRAGASRRFSVREIPYLPPGRPEAC